jgi:mRNA interferase MazF
MNFGTTRKTRLGNMLRAGDVIIATVQFTDTGEVKARPAVVLFEELGNVVIAGITSNLKMKGIPLAKSEGAIKDSVIKLNYIFTISNEMVSKVILHLSKEKKRLIFEELSKRIDGLKS